MKILKFAFAAVLLMGLSSFVLVSSFHKEEKAAPPIDQKLYHKFLAKFEKAELPYTLSPEKAKTVGEYFDLQQKAVPFNEEKHLGREFSDILPAIARGMMSRMGPDDYQAEVLLAASKHFNALIYSRTPAFREGQTYFVATFDADGHKIDEIAISASYYRTFKEATIDEDLNISMRTYEVEGMDGEEEDELRYQLKESKDYAISPNGTIVETSSDLPEKSLNKQLQQKQDFGAADKKVRF
jgi:hypothetical protein